MRKVRLLPGILLLLIAAGAAALLIRFFPCLQGAAFLNQNGDLGRLSFDVTLKLSEEALSQEQTALFDTLAQITGTDKEALLTLHIRGQSWEELLYFEITPEGSEVPLTELYLGEQQDVVNAAMLYNAVRSNLAGQYELLDLLLPQWSGEEYMSLEQAGQMLGLDLSWLGDFSLSDYENMFSYWEYFVMLAVMKPERASDGSQEFSLHTDFAEGEQEKEGSADLKLRLQKNADPSVLSAEFEVNNLPMALDKLDSLLVRMGREESFSEREGLRRIESLAGSLTIGEAHQLQMPDALMDQDTVERIAAIRQILQEMLGR